MLVYFDSCVFISWLKGEVGSQSINDLVRSITTEECTIITSAIGVAEIWPDDQYLPARYDQYQKMLLAHIGVIPVDLPIAQESVKIANILGQKRKIRPPDAIHVATAIKKKADYLCTIDSDILAHAQSIRDLSKNTMDIIKPPLPISRSLLF